MQDIDYTTLYEEAIPSVVSVYTNTSGRQQQQGAGSGYVHDANHVVTNAHVVRKASSVELRFNSGQWCTGNVVGTDTYTDLAVIAVDDMPDDVPPLSIADESPQPGTPVAALGNPLGLDGSITAGIISGTNRSMPTAAGFSIPDVIQTDAAINPGNSGGPLVARVQDETYEVVGLNRAKSGDNIGFAVSNRVLERVVPQLIDHGTAKHAWLQIRTVDVSPTIADANGLDEAKGVLVVETTNDYERRGLLSGSDRAARVGRKKIPVGGDVVLGIDGVEIHSHEELTRYLVTEVAPGDTVAVELVRDGQSIVKQIELEERPPLRPDQQRQDIYIG